MRIEIISNVNMDSLRVYLEEHQTENNSSYGNYLIDLLDEESNLYRDGTEGIFCFLDIDTLNDNIETILNALLKVKKQKNKIILINTLSSYPFYIDTYTHGSIEKEQELNKKILNFSKKHQFLIVDFNSIVKRIGAENIYSGKYWYMGKIKYSNIAFKTIAEEVTVLLDVRNKSCKKCLVLDMDNTLWKGVIGEEKIELSNEGIGMVFQDFQRKIKKLKDLGILLAINSKNNVEDAMKGLEHNASLLKKNDFILIKANWTNKDENIRAIADELNIGEDSLVFIDDSPIERDLVTKNTKATVPNFPEDIYTLNDWFVKEVVYKFFYKTAITNEDLDKQKQYGAKLKRDEEAKKTNYKDFLKSLEIKLSFHINDSEHISRLVQLTQKTNQFNLTTKRYTEEDIQHFIDDDAYVVISVDYRDRYAKEGIVGLIIAKRDGKDIGIDTFLLSCRILKRGVEKKLIDKIVEFCEPDRIIGFYEKSEKNAIVKNLYPSLGFKKINKGQFEKEFKWKKK